jgi:hypothetical protein
MIAELALTEIGSSAALAVVYGAKAEMTNVNANRIAINCLNLKLFNVIPPDNFLSIFKHQFIFGKLKVNN